ncbi:MAG: PqqD family protein [Deltaproteobacteria bacterium]|nr:PqqD family protein [Deltaproteobacteria bacterium]MBW1816981.1 PqqD family protein [Deltaproteobacteria bacterium]
MAWIQGSTEKTVWEKTDDEIVLIHTETSAYYGLNSTGSWLWECMVQQPYKEDELVDLVVHHLHQEPEHGRLVVSAFIATLREADLIVEQDHAPDRDASAEVPPAPTPYEVPTMVKFGDLETLFLSGE